MVCVIAKVSAQQTLPVQPKTVDIPKLVPLISPSVPQGSAMLANAPLSAAEAVKIALVHQPQVLISKAAADAAHGQTLQSKALLNPTVGLTSSGTHSQAVQNGTQGLTSGPISEIASTVALNQLLYDFNRTRDLVRQSEALERAGFRTYDQTLQDVALQTKQDFYSFVQAQQEAKVQEANVKSRQAQVDLTQATVNAGTGEPSDLVNAKTLVAQSIIAWSQAQQTERIARVKLATDMGIDPRTPLVVAPSVETNVQLPSDENSLVDLALKQRPSILAAIESLKASGYAVSIARKNDAPSINFQAGLESLGTSNPFDHQVGYVSLTLNWTLLDGGVQLGKVRTAQANKSAAAEQLREASQNTIQDVSNAVVSVQAARQQIPVANSEVANAEEGVRLAEGRYRAGVATFQEVITAQANLVTAQTDQVNAVAALAIALASLDHAIGKWPVS